MGLSNLSGTGTTHGRVEKEQPCRTPRVLTCPTRAWLARLEVCGGQQIALGAVHDASASGDEASSRLVHDSKGVSVRAQEEIWWVVARLPRRQTAACGDAAAALVAANIFFRPVLMIDEAAASPLQVLHPYRYF